jgi:hypothetical protein
MARPKRQLLSERLEGRPVMDEMEKVVPLCQMHARHQCLQVILIVSRVDSGQWAVRGGCGPRPKGISTLFGGMLQTGSAVLIGRKRRAYLAPPHGSEASNKGVLASEKLDFLVRTMTR